MSKNVNKIALAISMAMASATSVYAQEATQEPDGIEDIEKVVVVGEKTERSLKETTSSIAVIAEEDISSMRYKSIHDAVSEIPNIVAISGLVPDIRGVSGNGSAGGFNSISGGAKARVTTIVDGVAIPFVADLSGDTGLWDIQQVEVYRGPQSTSNGRNSMAGAIYIKTNDPTDEWEGKVRLGYRNQDSYLNYAGVVSGPLSDDVAFRLSVQRVDGDTITNGEGYADNPPDYDIDAIETSKVNGKLLWTPSDDLSIKLTHDYNNEKGDAGRVYYQADDLSQYNRLFYRNIETEASTTSVIADYTINDALSLDVIVATMDYEWGFNTYQEDPAATQFLTFDESNFTFDAKLNIGQSNDTFSGFIGLAYFEREHDVISTGATVYDGDDESDSMAIYGEMTYAVRDDFNVIVGARVERESQLRHFVYGAIDSTLDNDTNIFLPKLVLQYDVTQDTTLALSARKGYNAAGGALNFAAQEYYYFDSEEVMTYEFSSRTSFDDNKGFLQANVFYNDYDGYQALSSTRFIVNMDKVVTYGAELAVNWMATEDLELNAGLGLLETEIKDAAEEYPDADGNELNSAPKITANVGLKYWITDGFNVGVAANYVDEYYGDFTNTPTRVAGDYSLVRLFASYETENWLISGFVNNALDEEAFTAVEPASGRYPTGYVAIVDPRNVGVSVTYSF